ACRVTSRTTAFPCYAKARNTRSIPMAKGRSWWTCSRTPGPENSNFLYSSGGRAMNRLLVLVVVIPVGVLSTAAVARPQKPAETTATPENIEAAFKISLAAAAEYEFRVGKDENDKPLELVRESRLKWSNPAASDIQGNVFVWTRDGRPLVVGCFMKWFSPRSVMQHEFHPLPEEPLK